MSKIEEAMKLIGPGCACEVNLGNILVLTGALKEAIEQHEAFRQEVSDAVEHFKRCYPGYQHASLFDRFIITKPDPLVEAMRYITAFDDAKAAEQLRAELAKRGLEIREKSDG